MADAVLQFVESGQQSTADMRKRTRDGLDRGVVRGGGICVVQGTPI